MRERGVWEREEGGRLKPRGNADAGEAGGGEVAPGGSGVERSTSGALPLFTSRRDTRGAAVSHSRTDNNRKKVRLGERGGTAARVHPS